MKKAISTIELVVYSAHQISIFKYINDANYIKYVYHFLIIYKVEIYIKSAIRMVLAAKG